MRKAIARNFLIQKYVIVLATFVDTIIFISVIRKKYYPVTETLYRGQESRET